jgi:hypothetical protein
MNRLSLALNIGVAFGLACSAQADQIRSGKWEFTSKSQMTGMPVQMPTQTHKTLICIDNKNKDVPPIGADPSCKFSNYKVTNNSASFRMQCSGDMKMSGTGSITFNGDQYTGDSVMKMEMDDTDAMTIRNSYSAKRIGDC